MSARNVYISGKNLPEISSWPVDKAKHFFDKLLKIPSIMMTNVGDNEAQKRRFIMVDFLRELFRENDSIEWADYLEEFLGDQQGV